MKLTFEHHDQIQNWIKSQTQSSHWRCVIIVGGINWCLKNIKKSLLKTSSVLYYSVVIITNKTQLLPSLFSSTFCSLSCFSYSSSSFYSFSYFPSLRHLIQVRNNERRLSTGRGRSLTLSPSNIFMYWCLNTLLVLVHCFVIFITVPHAINITLFARRPTRHGRLQ